VQHGPLAQADSAEHALAGATHKAMAGPHGREPAWPERALGMACATEASGVAWPARRNRGSIGERKLTMSTHGAPARQGLEPKLEPKGRGDVGRRLTGGNRVSRQWWSTAGSGRCPTQSYMARVVSRTSRNTKRRMERGRCSSSLRGGGHSGGALVKNMEIRWVLE
jgi:hypothetical protein